MLSNYNKEKPIIFYPMTRETPFFINTVLNEYGLEQPVCICDRNDKLWHKAAYENGPVVLPLEEAIKKNPNLQIFIPTFSDIFKYEIVDYLISKAGILREQILNYEPVKEVKIEPVNIIKKYDKEKTFIFYPVTKEISFFVKTFLKEYGLKEPFFICDKNNKLWNKTAYDNGPIVLPLKDTIEKNTDFQIFIPTFSDVLKYKVEEYLTSEVCISKERILNYEPYIERYGCVALNNSIIFFQKNLSVCCYPKFNSALYKTKLTKNIDENIFDIVAYTRKLATLDRDINPCKDCPSFLFGRYSLLGNDMPIRRIHYPHTIEAKCNFMCSYCNSHKPDNQYKDYRKSNKENRVILNNIKYLIDNKLISNLSTMMSFAHGEIGIFPYRDEYLDLTSEFYQTFTSNCSIYIERLHDLLKGGKAFLNCSLDCGTRDTFLRIKNVDVFDRVAENLVKYSEDAPKTIELKYIFLPGINDNEKDIYNFIILALKIKVLKVILSMDMLTENVISKETAMKIMYFVELGNSEKIRVEISRPTFSKESLRILKEMGIPAVNISQFNLDYPPPPNNN